MLHRTGFTLTAASIARRLPQPPRAIVAASEINYASRPLTSHIRTEMTASRRSARLSASGAEAKAAAAAMPPPPQTTTTATSGRKRKAVAQNGTDAPTTPKKKKIAAPPPLTPTPSAVGIISEPHRGGGGGSDKPKPAAVSRLADPRGTNATLLSPETSRLINPRDEEPVSPSKGRGKSSTTTTRETLLKEACDYLIKVDERMRPLVERYHCHAFSPEGLAERIDPFESITSGIISQQVSGAAAKSIKNKFVALFADGDNNGTAVVANGTKTRFPHPSEVATTPLETLRTAGLSQRKAEYIQGLAEKFKSGELSAQMLHDAPYDEVLEKLTAVRGLGRWSVEMFACFGLKRMDVFSLGDLGVQRGMAAFVGRDVAKLRNKGGKWKYMSEQDMTELSDKFAPYRSLFMWYMWRVEETDVSTMES